MDNRKIFNIIGWLLLLGVTVLWFSYGYLDNYLFVIPAAALCFAISDGRIKKLNKIKKLTILQVLKIIFFFFLSVIIVFALIQLANYLIQDVLHIQGWVKTISQFIAVILALYPIKFAFRNIIYRINENIK